MLRVYSPGFRVEGKLQVKVLQCWVFGMMLQQSLNIEIKVLLQKPEIEKPTKTNNSHQRKPEETQPPTNITKSQTQTQTCMALFGWVEA